MVRKSLYVAIPYTIGFLLANLVYDSEYSYLAIVISFVVTGLLLFVVKLGLKPSILCETSFLVGFLILSNYMVTHVSSLQMYNDQVVNFTGKVIEVTDYTSSSSYVLDGYVGERRIKLSLYTNTLDCSYGDTITITGTLSKISGNYLFDSKSYYNSKGIYLEIEDTSSIDVTHNDSVLLDIVRGLQAYRNNVIDTFKYTMSKNGSSLLTAILFGDKSDLSKDNKNSLLRSGLGSLMAVSGFHLAVLTSLLDVLFRLLDKHDFSPPRIIKFLLYEIFMILFIIVIDFPISAVRTCIMLSINNIATLLFRKPDTLTTLSITTMVMISIEPYLIGNVSFLLSVMGVFGIGVLSPYLIKGLSISKYFRGVFSIAVTTACTVPISSVFFNEVSILSPITNLICIPLCEISLVCGFLVFILGGKAILINRMILYIADISCRAIVWICSIFSKISIGNVPTGYSILIYILIICVLICILSYGIFKNAKRLGAIILASLIIVSVSLGIVRSIENNVLRVSIMGNSNYKVMIISYKNDINVVDFSKNYKTASYLQTYLQRYGNNSISSITFLKKAYQTITMYGVLLNDYSIDTINVPLDINLRSNYTILEVSPTRLDLSDSKLIYYYDDYVITVFASGEFQILYNDVTESFNIQEYNITFKYYSNGQFMVKELD